MVLLGSSIGDSRKPLLSGLSMRHHIRHSGSRLERPEAGNLKTDRVGPNFAMAYCSKLRWTKPSIEFQYSFFERFSYQACQGDIYSIYYIRPFSVSPSSCWQICASPSRRLICTSEVHKTWPVSSWSSSWFSWKHGRVNLFSFEGTQIRVTRSIFSRLHLFRNQNFRGTLIKRIAPLDRPADGKKNNKSLISSRDLLYFDASGKALVWMDVWIKAMLLKRTPCSGSTR